MYEVERTHLRGKSYGWWGEVGTLQEAVQERQVLLESYGLDDLGELYIAKWNSRDDEWALQDSGTYYFAGTEAECENALIQLGLAVAQQEKD